MTTRPRKLPTGEPSTANKQSKLSKVELQEGLRQQMLDDALQTRLRRRQRAIPRWLKQDISRRGWFSFAEIADELARLPGGIKRDESIREQAYIDLMASFRNGKFDRDGSSTILLKSLSMAPFPRSLLDGAKESNDPETFQRQYVEQFYLPRRACAEWFVDRNLPWPVDWGDSAARALTNGPTKPLSDDALRTWYAARVKQCVAAGKEPTRREDWRAATADLGTVSQKRVHAIRNESAPSSWTARGRRKDRTKK